MILQKLRKVHALSQAHNYMKTRLLAWLYYENLKACLTLMCSQAGGVAIIEFIKKVCIHMINISGDHNYNKSVIL